MERRIGYACVNLTLGRSIRAVRLANLDRRRAREVALENLETVRRMAQWNAANGVRMMRLSSDLVPFAGREDANPWWRDDLRDALGETGRVLRDLDQRVSAHPGQYTVLSSPRPEVVEASAADLAAQADLFARMEVEADVVIHVGGAYGDPEEAVRRFGREARRLPPAVRNLLVVENDDRVHGFAAALAASDAAGVPLVFDVLHHAVLPDPEGRDAHAALTEALATWRRHRPHRTPKIHWSDPAPGKRAGAHADKVDPEGFWRFIDARSEAFDVMLEAKAKEQALLPVLARRPTPASSRSATA